MRYLLFLRLVFMFFVPRLISRIYPPHWWVDMKLNTVQVLVRSTDPTFSKQTFTVNYRLAGGHVFE